MTGPLEMSPPTICDVSSTDEAVVVVGTGRAVEVSLVAGTAGNDKIICTN